MVSVIGEMPFWKRRKTPRDHPPDPLTGYYMLDAAKRCRQTPTRDFASIPRTQPTPGDHIRPDEQSYQSGRCVPSDYVRPDEQIPKSGIHGCPQHICAIFDNNFKHINDEYIQLNLLYIRTFLWNMLEKGDAQEGGSGLIDMFDKLSDYIDRSENSIEVRITRRWLTELNEEGGKLAEFRQKLRPPYD